MIRNLKILFPFIIAFCFNQAVAGTVANYNRNLIQDVYVFTDDSASEACWTNLKNSREYAEEKLRSKGIKTRSEAGAEYILKIDVLAFRDGTGWCVGTIQISLETLALVDTTMPVSAIVGKRRTIVQVKDNLNNDVLDMISKLVSDL